MPLLLRLVTVAGLMLAAGAFAGHAQSISDGQRGEIGKIIREYLVAHPEMLQDATNERRNREPAVEPANDGRRDDVLPKVQVQGAPQMTAGCPCIQMMSGENMPKEMTSRSTGGAMGRMSGGGATASAGGAASGCCGFPQQQAAASNQSGDQTLLAGAEELFLTNPLLMPAQNTPEVSTASSAGTSANDLEKWSGPELGRFTLRSLSSSEVALSDYLGKPVILHFFATWCGPCREEMEGLRRFVSRIRNNDLSVLAVSVGEPEDRVRRFFDTVPVNFPILLDRDMTITRAWRVATLPTTYVLSPELKPKLILRGAQQWGQLDVAQILKKLDEANQEPSQPVGRQPTAPPEKK